MSLDHLWKAGLPKRYACYRQLAAFMGLTEEEAHIGLFDEFECAMVVRFAEVQRVLKGA